MVMLETAAKRLEKLGFAWFEAGGGAFALWHGP